MKRPLFYLMLAAAFMTFAACSCNPINNDPENNGENTQPNDKPEDKPDEEALKPGTFKFVASTLKGKWNPGDQIFVHGTLAAWAEIVTLTASNISEDGKVATAELNDVTTAPAGPDGLYAAWPAEAVKGLKGKLGTKTFFSSCDQLLTVAYLKKDTFTFTDASSSLAFSVDGDYDSYALAANNRDGVIVTNFEVEYTSEQTAFTQKQKTGYQYLYGSVEPGNKVMIWMPGNMSFKRGLTLFLGKEGLWSAVYKLAGDVVLETAKCMNLGNITAKLESYDGPAPKMPKMTGKTTKYSVNIKELSGICLSENQDFLWGLGDEGDLAKISFTGEVLSTVHVGGDSEDVSRNPETGDLLIGLEPNGVGVIKAPSFNSYVETLFSIPACNSYGNSGIEGIAYYKDGKVFVGAQHNSHLFLCDLATKTVLWSITPWEASLISEVGGLCYDSKTDWLWIIDSESKKVFVLSAEKLLTSEAATDQEKVYDAMLGAYPVPDGSNPESVCVDHNNSCIWVGDDDDNSYLYRYDMTGLDDFIINE